MVAHGLHWLKFPHNSIAASPEDLDWSSSAGGSSSTPDWPSIGSSGTTTVAAATAGVTSSGTSVSISGDLVITQQDSLQSVLERLGLMEYHQLFWVLCVLTTVHKCNSAGELVAHHYSGFSC